MGKKSGGLGRGLEALIGSDIPDINSIEVGGSQSIAEVPMDEIEANPSQPRKNFDPEELVELSNSIKTLGLITPITLRKVDDFKYQIIAGERRFRANEMAGNKTILAYVCEVSDGVSAEMALAENIQRSDLNPIEIALSYKNLMEMNNYTQEQLSERVGKNRSSVSNYVRLLSLPSEIQMGLTQGKLGYGHARALLSIEDPAKQTEVYKMILNNGISVRKVEEIAKKFKEGGDNPKPNESQTIPEEYAQIAKKLGDVFGQKVEMSRNAKGKGKISINFSNDGELEKIMEVFDRIDENKG